MDAPAWAAAVVASDPRWDATNRRRIVQIAAEMGAVDERTLPHFLNAVSIDAADGQITLGWMRSRGRGGVAGATHRRAGALRLLDAPARPQ